jgi:hypothetical protein
MGVRVTLAGQDITPYVDELSIDIESNLGQGPGVPQGSSGRATTCKFQSLLGPQGQALGAGQTAQFPMNAYQTAVLGDHPVALYRLGDAAGSSNIADAANNNGSSTSTNGSPILGISPGAAGGMTCADLNGGYWGLPMTKMPSGGSALTFECWVLLQSIGQQQALMAIGTAANNGGIWLGVTSTGIPTLQVYGTSFGSPAATCNGNFALSLNQWHSVIGFYTGSFLVIWVDNAHQNSVAYSSLNTPNNFGAFIGAGVGQNHWTNLAAECAFYNYSINVSQAQNHYAARQATPALVRQGETIIYDSSGTRIFGGYATDLQDKTEYTRVKTDITCSDYWQDTARHVVNQIYTSEYDNQILLNLFQTYAPDIDLSAWSQTQTYLFTKIYLRAKTLQESVQKIADTVGFDTWIDPYKKFRYQSPSTSGTAPFSLTDAPDFIRSFPCSVTTYEKDDTAIINRVFFYGGKTPSTDFTQNLSAQCNGANTTLVLAYYPREASDGKIHLYKNAVELAMGRVFAQGAANTLKSQGGTADALLNSSAQAITFDVAPLATDTITCKYRYEVPLTVMVTNQTSYSYFGRYYDGVISDTTVQDKTTAIQRARILLLEQAFGFEHLTIKYYKPGIQAGMLLRVDHNVRGIHNAYIVQSVKTKPLGNGQFEYTVELGAWNWNLVDIMVQAGKLAHLIDQLDDESEDVVTAEQINQNLGAHIVLLSPITRTSGVYYARATPVGDGHDAYPGLFTITS